MKNWFAPLSDLAALHGVRPYVAAARRCATTLASDRCATNRVRQDRPPAHRTAACATLLLSLLVAGNAQAQDPSGETTAADRAAIQQVLDNYRNGFSHRDEALFMTTMLDAQIPLFSANDKAAQDASLASADFNQLAGFRRAVFHSAHRYRQTFDHVTIQQDRSLAAVWLHFITQPVPSGTPVDGWKTLQMMKIGKQWKIVSELFTVADMPTH